jgi:hypothetical protein
MPVYKIMSMQKIISTRPVVAVHAPSRPKSARSEPLAHMGTHIETHIGTHIGTRIGAHMGTHMWHA